MATRIAFAAAIFTKKLSSNLSRIYFLGQEGNRIENSNISNQHESVEEVSESFLFCRRKNVIGTWPLKIADESNLSMHACLKRNGKVNDFRHRICI